MMFFLHFARFDDNELQAWFRFSKTGEDTIERSLKIDRQTNHFKAAISGQVMPKELFKKKKQRVLDDEKNWR